MPTTLFGLHWKMMFQINNAVQNYLMTSHRTLAHTSIHSAFPKKTLIGCFYSWLCEKTLMLHNTCFSCLRSVAFIALLLFEGTLHFCATSVHVNSRIKYFPNELNVPSFLTQININIILYTLHRNTSSSFG